MERLTYNSGKQWEINGSGGMPCDDVCENRGLAGCGGCPIQKAFDRLAAYEDTGLTPEEIKSMIPPTNDPITLEELLEMDGEPVWVESPGVRKYGRWAIVDGVDIEHKALFLLDDFTCHDYGTVWLAYRRKPEDGKG